MTDLVSEHVPLAGFTTMGVGGTARYLNRAVDETTLRAALEWARERTLPVFVLGGGSNVVFGDGEFAGLVIRNEIHGLEFSAEGETVLVRASAGEDWDAFVAATIARDLAGIECLSGIPGSVGATPIQNVGAYGQEVAETIETVEAIDRETLDSVTFSNADCGFDYRTSRFKGRDRDRYVVTAVTFRLRPGGAPAIRYPELARHLEQGGVTAPGLADVRQAVLAIRRRKAMVVDPAEPNSRSCGSFFMNPVVSREEAAAVEERGRSKGVLDANDTMPAYACDDGQVKLSAAWLIEHAGLKKGMRHGNVGLSERHVLALVNFGNGTAREILELKSTVQARVREVFGIDLTPEPVIVQ
jgi:UDP-N-acetylmuramate dehydrogenase